VISWIRVFEKMFWAMEIEIAPPRELKKIAIASVQYMSAQLEGVGGV